MMRMEIRRTVTRWRRTSWGHRIGPVLDGGEGLRGLDGDDEAATCMAFFLLSDHSIPA